MRALGLKRLHCEQARDKSITRCYQLDSLTADKFLLLSKRLHKQGNQMFGKQLKRPWSGWTNCQHKTTLHNNLVQQNMLLRNLRFKNFVPRSRHLLSFTCDQSKRPPLTEPITLPLHLSCSASILISTCA